MTPAHDGSEGLDVGRRCHVTLLFSDLCDFTRLNETADPEDVAALLHTTKQAAAKIVERHGGTLNQFYGDGLLAVFGLPASSEDDARRAVETALELHEKIRALSVDFARPAAFATRLHSGIHSGLVFARTSDARDGRYEIVGDPINTASRLCAAAGPDEILASEVTLRAVAPFFETVSIAPLRLKGKYEPLPAVRLIGRSGLSTRFEARTQRGLTPFVGRSAELARLSQSLDNAIGGSPRLVHVSGDVGLGKTRLLAEFRKSWIGQRANVYVGCCDNYGHVPPLQPFLQILSQVFELEPDVGRSESLRRIEGSLEALGLGSRAALFAQLLAPALNAAPASDAAGGREADPGAHEQSVPAAMTALLLALGTRHPLVLLFDDWQWADDASYRALGQLLGVLAEEPRPILVITASRPEARLDPITSLGEVLELEPLSKAESQLAIADLLPRAPGAFVAESIEARAGGNPLFLEELCQAWPYAARDADAASNERVPSSLHGLIQTRVERLPSDLARIARAAAVIGSEFDAWLLDRIIDDESARGGLERLEQSALVYSSERPGVYRFKHGVTRDVVYDSVRLVERRRLHAAIANAIESKSGDAAAALHCESLAYHYSGAAKPSRAAKYAEIAGDKAALSSSLDRARQHYRAALSELERLPGSPQKRARWLAICRKWAAACVFSPAPEQLETLSRALDYTEELGDQNAVAHSHYWLGWIHYALGEQERATLHTEHALSLIDHERDSRLVAQLLANLGQIHTVAGDPNEALRCLTRAVDIKRGHAKRAGARLAGGSQRAREGSESVPVGFAYALGCQGLVHGYLGNFAEARLRIDEALQLVAGTQHAIEASLLGLLGMIQLWQGTYRQCIETSARMRGAAERVRGPYVFAMSQTIGGYARWMLERDQKALGELRAAVDWLEQHQMRLLMSFGFSCVAEALAADGQFEEARRYATLALERADQLDRLGEVTARRVLALCSATEPSSLDVCSNHLEEAGTLALARGSLRESAVVRLDQARLLQNSGEPLIGASLAVEALEEFRAMGMQWHAEQAERICEAGGATTGAPAPTL